MKLCRTRLNSEVIYSGKDSVRFQKTNDKKKEEVKPKLSGEKNVSRTKAVLRQYPLFFKVKIYFPAQTTSRQL